MTTAELMEILKERTNSLIVNVNGVGKETVGAFFEYDAINYEDGKIVFGRRNCSEKIMLYKSAIKKIHNELGNPDVIHIDLNNGTRWTVCLFGYKPYKEPDPDKLIAVEDFADKLEHSGMSALWLEVGGIKMRTVYANCQVGEIEDDGTIKIDFSADDNTFTLTLLTSETKIEFAESTDKFDSYRIYLSEMAFSSIMIFLYH